jgi:ABC-type nitrate/sulfonate/bicarbonate transport system substrate-binding protein
MADSFNFYLDWIICAQFAGQCWALDRGLYAAAGLDVTLVPWQEDGRTIIEKVVAGGSGAGCSEDNIVVSAAAKHGNVKIIGAMLQGTPLVLMSRPQKRIRSLQDLRGKRIGMHKDGNRALAMVLSLEGIAPGELEIHEVPFDLDYLKHDRVDALQGYLMTEPVQLEAMGVSVEVLPVSHARLRPYAQAYFASTDMIAAGSSLLSRFLAASKAGWRAVLQQPDEAADVVAKMMGDAAQAPEQRRMLDKLLPLVAGALPHERIGEIDVEQWRRNLATYFEHGLTDRPLDLNDAVDLTLANGATSQ